MERDQGVMERDQGGCVVRVPATPERFHVYEGYRGLRRKRGEERPESRSRFFVAPRAPAPDAQSLAQSFSAPHGKQPSLLSKSSIELISSI
eukprot:1754234-Prymnesium_polylepis.1